MLNFKETFPAYALGRRVNSEEWNTITRISTGATALAFGVPVTASGAKGVVVVTAAGQVVLGITEASQVLPHTGDNYAQYDNVAVCEVGVIGVLLDDAVVAKAQARFNTATGKWTDAAASATVLTIPGAEFEHAGAADTIGVVRYRRPILGATAGA